MATNDFLPFADAATDPTVVMSQATYAAWAYRPAGFPQGETSRAGFNKALRQANAITAAVAQAVVDSTGSDLLDNGDDAAQLAAIKAALLPNVGQTATVAGLASISTTRYAAVVVTGYAADGDCPARVFRGDSTDSTTPADGVTCFVSADGKRWKWVPKDKIIDLRCFGVKGDDATDDYTAIKAAEVFCAANDYGFHFFAGGFRIGATWKIESRVQITSDASAIISPTGSAVDGVQIASTVATNAEFQLPGIANFTSGKGLALLGCSLAHIRIPQIINCATSVALITSNAGGYSSCLNNTVEFQSCSMGTTAVEVIADNNANVMQGNRIVGNFVTDMTNAILFNAPGIDSNWDSNFYYLDAFDPTPAKTGSAWVRNNSASACPRWEFMCKSWLGGFATDSVIVDGSFNSCVFDFKLASGLDTYSQWNLTGTSNTVNCHFNDGRLSTSLAASTAANARATFNSGAPVKTNKMRVSCTLAANLTADNYTTFYVYHPFQDTYSEQFKLSPINMNGLVVNAISSGANASEIAIELHNVSTGTKAAGTVVAFYLTVGVP